MENATEAEPRIRVGRTEMDFPHQGKILTAVHPFYGPANSRTLQNLIRKEGYVEPTSAQLTSFIHEYFNGDEPQAKEVNQIMKNRHFKGFTGILYIPQEQIAHFIDYPEFSKDSIVNRDNLFERLTESYAQVPFEHLKEGSVNWRKVAKHPYFVAWAGGKEGAEKLAKLASKHPRKEAYIGVPNVSYLKKSIAEIAMLGSSWDGFGLCVYSYDQNLYIGHTFGVQKIKQKEK